MVLIQAPPTSASSVEPFTDFRYGDRVRAEGKLQTPTNAGDFDYREYLARQDVYSIMLRPRLMMLARDQGFAPLGWIYSFKARAKNVIAQILPEPQASLLPAFCWATMRQLAGGNLPRPPQECSGCVPHDGYVPYHRDQRLDVKPNRM